MSRALSPLTSALGLVLVLWLLTLEGLRGWEEAAEEESSADEPEVQLGAEGCRHEELWIEWPRSQANVDFDESGSMLSLQLRVLPVLCAAVEHLTGEELKRRIEDSEGEGLGPQGSRHGDRLLWTEGEARHLEPENFQVFVNGFWQSSWVLHGCSPQSDSDLTHLCHFSLYYLRPGPARVFVSQVDDGGHVVASSEVTFFADASGLWKELSERNQWLRDEEFTPRLAKVLTNVAEKKKTWQHSTALFAGPERAVDGNTNTTFQEGSCTHTGGEDGLAGSTGPWWTVDLGSKFDINHVTIFNRGDCCEDRLRGFRVLLSNQTFETFDIFSLLREAEDCGSTDHFHPSSPLTLACRGFAQMVTVWLPGSNRFLTLCEVQVWADSSQADVGDAVIGLADMYTYDQIFPFAMSLRNTGFQGRIFIFTSAGHKLCEDMFSQGFTCKAVLRSLAALGVTIEEWPQDIVRPDARIPYHTDLVRLELYGRFAALAESRGILRILASDTKDVFFQLNPFNVLGDEELHLFEESIVLGTEGINVQWLESCWGPDITKALEHDKVLCSGTVAGTPSGIQAYAKALLTLFNEGFQLNGAKCLVGDQAMLNLAHYKKMFEVSTLQIWPNAEVVATLGTDEEKWLTGCAKGQCGWVLSRKAPHPLIPVIHQYQSKPPIGVALIGTLFNSQSERPRDLEYQPPLVPQLRAVFTDLQEANLERMLQFAEHKLNLSAHSLGPKLFGSQGSGF